MLLLDVNILVYVFHAQAPDHGALRGWLLRQLEEGQAVGLCDPVLTGVLRVSTLPFWRPPATLAAALEFIERLRQAPSVAMLRPGPGHWRIFAGLCRDADARGNLVPDAWLAALAIEHGATLVTADRDFARFPGLSWRHPLR